MTNTTLATNRQIVVESHLLYCRLRDINATIIRPSYDQKTLVNDMYLQDVKEELVVDELLLKY